MGVENNNAVLATTWNDECVQDISNWIGTLPEELQGLFAVVPAISNGKTTVVCCPDGSKEGWDVSNQCNELRQKFIEQLDDSWEWIEVGYGEYGQKVLRGNNSNLYNDKEYAA